MLVRTFVFYKLIPLLPTDIVELIVKEMADKGDNYQHKKSIDLNSVLWP